MVKILKKLTLALAVLLLAGGLQAAGPLEYAPALAVEQPPRETGQTSQTAAPAQKHQTAGSLEEAVQALIRELSAQEGFESWAKAEWTSYPLGPGTHGWVVLLKTDGVEAGYLVIQDAGAGRYLLSEYGRGEYPLFSLQTLHHSLVRLDLIPSDTHAERLYYNPLEALWQITAPGGPVRYLDAKTGEELPLHPGEVPHKELPAGEGISYQTGSPAPKPERLIGGSPFDAYERLPWVTSPPASPPSPAQLGEWLKQGSRPIYAAEVYGGRHLIPLAVTGLAVWSGGTAYVRALQDDDRYLPLGALHHLGGFYP
ncbi:hypothetical protein ACVNS2_10460 [Paenibacillus caseinilyticus]|uniref:Uncharacterized protein n=1 Tax=Paenibacillus mucilaginosus K02 TaxID=997761 RepID=V9IRE3_9BACL|nr:hypothetical protein [Paenibacillus mucilaginosus]AFK65232.1 hypothetical protein [Paenibacillus mucilaginosus K02]